MGDDKRTELIRIALHVAIAFLLVAPVFAQPFAYPDNYDFRYFITWIESGRRSLLWYGDFPLWNPWTCGGQVYLANPQSTIAAPTFLLALVFGTALGVKLTLVAYLFCALDGMYRLARHGKLDRDAAMVASLVFGGCGWLALHLASGHLNFAGATLLPYLMLCHRRAIDEWEWSIVLGALMAWIVGLGGTTTPAMATVFLGLSAVIELIRHRQDRPWRAITSLLLAVVVTIVIGGVRLLPMFQFVTDHPRPMFETDHNDPLFLFANAFRWMGLQSVAGKRYWFHEYGWKLPYLAWPFVIVGLRWIKARWELWVLFFAGLAIAAGSAIPYGPWWLMKNLPLFKDLRVPSRYMLLTAFAAALIVGATLQRVLAERPWRRAAMIALGVLFTVDVLAYSIWLYKGTFAQRMIAAAKPGAPFFHVSGHWRQMFDENMQNHGCINCDEEAPLQRAKELDVGNVPYAKLDDAAKGKVDVVRWAPSFVRLHVELAQPGQVILNTNWNEHWHTTAGTIVKLGEKVARDRDGGRLAVALAEGTYDLEVRYRPRTFTIGLWLTALGGPALLALFVVQRRRRRQAGEALA